jgi:membrane-bound serine protease (ClpP class)
MIVLLLFIVAVTFVYVELFLPGGVFGVLGVIAFAASIFFGFYYYHAAGIWIAVLELFLATALILYALRTFRTSYAGKLLILKRNLNKEEGYSGTDSLEKFVGKEGVCLTHLRPAGVAVVDSTRLDVVSDGTFIEKGKKIRVVEVEGNRVVVREMKSATSDVGG